MTRIELIEALKSLQGNADTEQAHVSADNLLLDFINDPEVRDAYDEIPKWYA